MARTKLNIGCRYSTPVRERPLHPTRGHFTPEPSQTQAPVTPATEPERRAGGSLTKDRDALLAFYDFPAEHWRHIRTTNPIESVFATVRHRTVRTKGCLSHGTTLAMVFKLITTASKTWRRLMGNNQLPKVIEGVSFKDGMQIDETKTRAAA